MSGKLVLYIACSLDGYIAHTDGSIGFLEENTTQLSQLGYDEFYSSVDVLIMGANSYKQLLYDISPQRWLYEGKTTFVYTHADIEESKEIKKAEVPPQELLEHIRKDITGDIWLFGGGETVKLFMQNNLVDRYMIYIMPNILGSGIPFFPSGFPSIRIVLESVRKIDEITEIIYNKMI